MKSIPQNSATTTQLLQSVRQIMQGGTNATGEVELATGSSTVVESPFAMPNSHVTISPITSNAAGIAWWIGARGIRTFTINHPAGPAGRRVSYEIRTS